MQLDSLKAVAVWQRAQLECIRDAIRARVQMAEYKQSDADLEMPSNASTNPIPKQFHMSNDINA